MQVCYWSFGPGLGPGPVHFGPENLRTRVQKKITRLDALVCLHFLTITDASLNEKGDKEICSVFDNIQVSCMSGMCRNVSSVYQCTFKVNSLLF